MSQYGPDCPKCGSERYSRGMEVADWCSECQTLFKQNGDEWTVESKP